MGWQDPKITVTMTFCKLFTAHNIVNTGPPTAGASSAACKYHLGSSCKPRFALGGRSQPLHPFPSHTPLIFAVFCMNMNGNLRGNRCSGHDRPPGANNTEIFYSTLHGPHKKILHMGEYRNSTHCPKKNIGATSDIGV